MKKRAADAGVKVPLHPSEERLKPTEVLALLAVRDLLGCALLGVGADMANGPTQRIPPFLETIALLEKLGSKNNHNCGSC